MSSAGDRGNLGCPLFTSSKLKVGGSVATITSRNITVVHSAPRRLLATLRTRGLSLDFAVLPAPTNAEPSEYAAWLDETQSIIVGAFKHTANLLVFIDANASIAAQYTFVSGDIHTTDHNGRSEHLLRFFNALNVSVPSTFSRFHNQACGDATWSHNAGKLFRIDFVALPQAWTCRNIATCVRGDIDLSLNRTDHWLVQLDFEAPMSSGRCPFNRKNGSFDVEALRTQTVIDSIRKDIGAFKPVPWNVEPSAHLKLITNQLHHSMRVHAPRATHTRKPAQWMRTSTHDLTRTKARMMHVAWHATRAARTHTLRAFFHVWKQIPSDGNLFSKLWRFVVSSKFVASTAFFSAAAIAADIRAAVAVDKNQWVGAPFKRFSPISVATM